MRLKVWKWRPGRVAMRRLMLICAFAAATIISFVWGRSGSQAQTNLFPPKKNTAAVIPPSDYDKRVVAYIYNNIPITREDLGEFLIERFGPDRLEFLVYRRILDRVCREHNVDVTPAEVDAQFQEDIKILVPGGMTEREFSNQFLKKFRISLYEWKEDRVKPRVQITKLCRQAGVPVTPQDESEAFDAKYGPKVQCRMIVLAEDNRKKYDVWKEASESEEKFKDLAAKQFLTNLAAQGGAIPPIHKHFADKTIEQEAFRLKVGEVSRLLEMPDKTTVILKCDKQIPAEEIRFDDVRAQLHEEVYQHRLSQTISMKMMDLWKEATPKLLLANGPIQQEQLEREVLTELHGGALPR